MSNKKNDLPERSGRDIAHSVTKAGLSALPIVGGPAAELFQNIVQPPLERRRVAWMADLGERLEELDKKGLNLENLKDNDQFISAAMHASQLALRTHSEEKRDALRNAVTNIAVGQAPEEAMQHVFLNFVDTLTELHIRILRLFQAPRPPQNITVGGLNRVLEHSMPEMKERRQVYDQLWRDLYLGGLVNTDSLHTSMSGPGLSEKRTTRLGDEFLSFISESK